MDKKIKNLLDFIKITDPIFINDFREVKMNGVEVFENENKWLFSFENNSILPFETYKEFSSKVKDAFSNEVSKIKIKFKISNDNFIFDDENKNNLKKYLNLINEKEKSKINDFILEDEKLKISVSDDIFEKRKVVNLFNSLGFENIEFKHLKNNDDYVNSEISKEFFHQIIGDREIKNSVNNFENKPQYNNSDRNNYGSFKQQTISGKVKNDNVTKISDFSDSDKNLTLEALIFQNEIRTLKKTNLLTLKLTDYSSSISSKIFFKNDELKKYKDLKKGNWIRAVGEIKEDDYTRQNTFKIKKFEIIEPSFKKDNVNKKRVELHAHTQMSAVSGIGSVDEYLKKAKNWGHEAIAITDNASTQAFPDASALSKKYGIRVIYGIEINSVSGKDKILLNENIEFNKKIEDTTYTVFDIETTGLSAVYDKIIELSAVKFKDGKVIETFSEFINPGKKLSETTIKLTSITDEMVKDSDDEKTVLSNFLKFSEDSVLVGHNVGFDMGFVNRAVKLHKLKPIKNVVIDTLGFARNLYPHFKQYRLNTLAKKFGINLTQHHRAIFDAETTAHLNEKLINEAVEKFDIKSVSELNSISTNEDNWKHSRPHHLTILAKNNNGIKNIYKLVSEGNINYFSRVPRVPKEILNKYKKDLIIGSGDEQGEFFETLVQKGYEEAKKIAESFDFLEIQPLDNYSWQLDNEFIADEKQLREILKQIVKIGEELNKLVVVTGNSHYIEEHDSIYRQILIDSQPNRPTLKFDLPVVNFKSTEELLKDFSFLGNDISEEIVVNNTNKILYLIDKENYDPIKKGSFRPYIEGADDQIRKMTYDQAHVLYGEKIPKFVEERIEKELNAIIRNNFSVIYLISQKLVKKSLKDGFLVGSRGSVGSSLVATLLGITEVNPLPPHYRSVNGNYNELSNDTSIGSGYDLPKKINPVDGTNLIGEGQNIPFETFLGFKGDKTPDIDLNFSGIYQPIAHNYTKTLFGENNVFRAGTISTVADKTAFGYVKKYEEEHNISYIPDEESRLAIGISGAKRTTGQHPGGILIVPEVAEINGEKKEVDILDFTPVQYPADKVESEWKTTHLDYHSIHDNLLKMDILGHDDPTMLRMLQDMTGIDPKTIPVSDSKIMQLFTSVDSLDIKDESYEETIGTFGIPEFGTKFVRNMLKDTKPTNYAELLQISGLSHGTDVWKGNADELIKNNKANISTVIGTRDKIMTDLIEFGIDPQSSFLIMEKVRKGKPLSEDDEKLLVDNNVPSWYIASAKKIKYMFPKAHAAAYVLMALRIAYFKVYFPTAYYSAYFSVRGDQLSELDKITMGANTLKAEIKRIKTIGDEASKNEKDSIGLYELALEAYSRGIEFKMVDLYKSKEKDWVIEGNKLFAPFISIPSLGDNVARQIISSRTDKEFISKKDLQQRGKVGKSIIQYLDLHGITEKLPEENQLTLF